MNAKDTMFYCKKNLPDSAVAGFMTAPWLLTIEKKYYGHLHDAYTFYNAKRDIYGE